MLVTPYCCTSFAVRSNEYRHNLALNSVYLKEKK
jgi:hypothetical protein